MPVDKPIFQNFKSLVIGYFIEKCNKLLRRDFLLPAYLKKLLAFKLCDFSIIIRNAFVDSLSLISEGGFLFLKLITFPKLFRIGTLGFCRLGLSFRCTDDSDVLFVH